MVQKRQYDLTNLSADEREAYRLLVLMITTMNMLCYKVHETLRINEKDLHEHFPTFARGMGAQGRLYESVSGKCGAVGIYQGTLDMAHVTLFFPSGAWPLHPEEEHTAEMQRAVPITIEILRVLRPNWNWQS